MAEVDQITEEKLVVEEQDALLRSYLETEREGRWLTELRLQALDRFSHMRWPTPQEEEWRRTDITGIDFLRYRPQARELLDWSAAAPAPSGSGIILTSLQEAVLSQAETLKPILLQGFEGLDNRFQAWHYSLLSEGLYLYVPPFLEISEPLVIELEVRGEKAVSAPHVVIVLDRGARVRVILRLKEAPGARLLVNAGVDVRIADAAALELVQLQELNEDSYHIHHGRASVARDGMLRHFEIILGGRLVKSRQDCSLEGPGSEALLNGLFFARFRQHMDIRTVQRHLCERANSRAFYKGAVKDSARTIYQGLIEVSPQAAKTDAYLSNKNLILNDGARADSIPSLRIETNDVRCSHGSTTGRINEEEVFYLTSRGLAPGEARSMLILGYFDELLRQLPDTLQEQLRLRIEARLAEKEGVENG